MKNIKQLYEAINNELRKLTPLISLDDIQNDGTSVIDILNKCGHYLLTANVSRQYTRQTLPESFRKQGVQITYNLTGSNITEEYIGSVENLTTSHFKNDENWRELTSFDTRTFTIRGIATKDTKPDTNIAHVLYFTASAGTYKYFDNAKVEDGFGILYIDEEGYWHAEHIFDTFDQNDIKGLVDSLKGEFTKGINDAKNELNQTINTKVNELDGKISSNKDAIDAAEDEIAALQEKVTSYDDDILKLKQKDIELEARDGQLTNKITSVSDTLDATKTKVNENTVAIEANKKAIEDNKAEVNQTITTVNSSLTNINTSISLNKTDADAKIEQLKAKDAELDEKDTELVAKDASQDEEIEKLKAKDEELAAKDAALEAKDTELAGKIADVDAKADSNKSDIDANKELIESNKAAADAAIAEIKSNIGTIDGNISEKITALEDKDKALDTKDAELEKKIGDLQTETTGAIASAKSELSDKISDVDTKADTNTENIKKTNQEIDTIKGNITDINDNISNVESEIDTVDKKVDDNKNSTDTTIAGINEKITTIETNVGNIDLSKYYTKEENDKNYVKTEYAAEDLDTGNTIDITSIGAVDVRMYKYAGGGAIRFVDDPEGHFGYIDIISNTIYLKDDRNYDDSDDYDRILKLSGKGISLNNRDEEDNNDYIAIENAVFGTNEDYYYLNKANGIPQLDANGQIPLNLLGNIDTTLYEVDSELPTTNIKPNRIYLVPATGDEAVGQNLYKEYIYTGDVNAEYDASKWEKFGEQTIAKVDLSEYIKTADVEAKYATKDSLNNYAEKSALTNYVQTSALADYVKKTALDDYVQKTALEDYATKESLDNYVQSSTLADYVTDDSLSTKLGDYLTSSSLDGYLKSADANNKFVDKDSLTETLADYLTSDDLTDYVTNTALTTKLADYATSASLSNYLRLNAETRQTVNPAVTFKSGVEVSILTITNTISKSTNGYLLTTIAEDRSATKVYNTNGEVTDLSNYAVLTDGKLSKDILPDDITVDLTDYYTKQEVDDLIKAASGVDLSNYVTKDSLTTSLTNYATVDSLTVYAKTEELAKYLPLTGGELTGNVTITSNSYKTFRIFNSSVDDDNNYHMGQISPNSVIFNARKTTEDDWTLQSKLDYTQLVVPKVNVTSHNNTEILLGGDNQTITKDALFAEYVSDISDDDVNALTDVSFE